MANLSQTESTTKTELLPVHRHHLHDLLKEGVQFKELNLQSAFTDVVWVEVEISPINIMNLFHAGTKIGMNRFTKQLTAA